MLVKLRRLLVLLKIWSLQSFVRLTGIPGAVFYTVFRLDPGPFDPSKKSVLCVNRPLFSKDIAELRKRTDLNWICIRSADLEFCQTVWLPKEMRIQTKYQSFRGGEHKPYWDKIGKFGMAVLKAVFNKYKIEAVIVGHIDYWQPEGIRLAAKKLELPYIALCREHMLLPMEQRTATEYYRGFKFEGDAVAVFGEQTRQIFIKSGACTPDQVVVTGAPRWDMWEENPKRIEPRDSVVLMTFYEEAYRARNCFIETLGAFIETAKNCKDLSLRFIVKAKNKGDLLDVLGLCQELPGNLTVTYQVDLHDLFPRSRAIIGFGSLSIVEALFTESFVIVPAWSDAVKDSEQLILDPNDLVTQRAVSFPKSRAEFLEALQAGIQGSSFTQMDRGARRKTIRKAVWINDEISASKLFEAVVKKSLAQNQVSHA